MILNVIAHMRMVTMVGFRIMEYGIMEFISKVQKLN